MKASLREIMDNLSSLNEDVTNLIAKERFVTGNKSTSANWNNIAIEGFSSIYTMVGGTMGVGGPTTAYGYGTLITLNPKHKQTSDYTITQIYIPDGVANRGIYARTNNLNWAYFTGTTVNAVS